MNIDSQEIAGRIDRFKTEVKRAGLKLTHQRLEIFREVASSAEHPDAIAVYKSIKERLPTMSLDTVYRTLWTLNDLGLITVLGNHRDSVRFDANLDRHHHFICIKCGIVRDFVSEEFNSLQVRKDVLKFGSALGTQIEVRGICNACTDITKEDHAGI